MIRLISTVIASALLLAPTSNASATADNSWKLSSPDGTLSTNISLSDKGELSYDLSIDGKQIVTPSKLGFEMRGVLKAQQLEYESDGTIDKNDRLPHYSLHDGFTVLGTESSSFDETWEPVWGEESQIRNHYNETLVHLQKGSRLIDVRFRLFDDGLGLRYEFPECNDAPYLCIVEELTEFNLAGDYTAWWIPGDFDTQEYQFTKSRLSEISSVYPQALRGNDSQTPFSTGGVQTSLQMKTDEGIYVNIHEAALVDYPCMHLLVDCEKHTMRSFLTPDAQGYKGRIQTPAKTPWRTVQLARSAQEQLASRLILNLNEPCALEDVSWIHPVKYMGVWWEMIAGAGSWAYTDEYRSVKLGQTDYAASKPNGRHSANNENVRKYIDFAAEHGFDAVLV